MDASAVAQRARMVAGGQRVLQAGGRGGPARLLRELWRTTLVALTAVGSLTIVIAIAAGLVSISWVGAIVSRQEAILADTEPQVHAAQALYGALSAADAAAAAAFVSGGDESAEVRARYDNAITLAASALTVVASGADAEAAKTAVELAVGLPAYSGLIETARANNRQGTPVGSAYLREASALLQESLLPEAGVLQAGAEAQLLAAQHHQGQFPFLPVAGGAATLAMLAWLSRLLTVRTRRSLNAGTLIAAGLTAVGMGWMAVAGGLAAGVTAGAGAERTSAIAYLTDASIAAGLARARETLALIGRTDLEDEEAQFARLAGDIGRGLDAAADALADELADYDYAERAELAAALTQSTAALADWRESHGRQLAAFEAGEYDAAVAIATGDAPDDSTAHFARLEARLSASIETTRALLRDVLASAVTGYRGAAPAVLWLALGASLAVAVGLWPRIREYQ